MNIVLWVLQVLLAAAFIMAGGMKLLQPIEMLTQDMAWVADTPALLVRFIGLSEIAGALGLVLPAFTRIKPQLTPLAGAGLALTMLLAAGFHATRGEFDMMAPPIVLLVLSGFTAYGRWKLQPIAPKE